MSDDFQQSLQSLTPHQMRIYQLIRQCRGRQLLKWQQSISHGSISCMVTCATRTMSPASSSPPQSSTAVPPPPSLRPPLSTDQYATHSSLKAPPMDSSCTLPLCMPLPVTPSEILTRSPLGSCPSSTHPLHTTTSSCSTPIRRGTGDWAGSSHAIACSPRRSPESRNTSTTGKRSLKCSRAVGTGVNSAWSKLGLESDYKRCRGSQTLPTGTWKKPSRISPYLALTCTDQHLALGGEERDRAKGGPHASRRAMTPASASWGPRA